MSSAVLRWRRIRRTACILFCCSLRSASRWPTFFGGDSSRRCLDGRRSSSSRLERLESNSLSRFECWPSSLSRRERLSSSLSRLERLESKFLSRRECRSSSLSRRECRSSSLSRRLLDLSSDLSRLLLGRSLSCRIWEWSSKNSN